jgi:NAD(P)H-hydrate epimerase
VSDPTKGFVDRLFSAESAGKLPPTVVDAYGLKLLAGLDDWTGRLPAGSVFTPHPGEMSILTGLPVAEIQKARLDIAESYARRWGAVVVLKGAFTVIASPGGGTALIPVATPALARAGTGDVLAGLVVGLMAQKLDSFNSAVIAAWIHAQAGLRAAAVLGSTSAVMAGDILQGVVDIMADVSE